MVPRRKQSKSEGWEENHWEPPTPQRPHTSEPSFQTFAPKHSKGHRVIMFCLELFGSRWMAACVWVGLQHFSVSFVCVCVCVCVLLCVCVCVLMFVCLCQEKRISCGCVFTCCAMLVSVVIARPEPHPVGDYLPALGGCFTGPPCQAEGQGQGVAAGF